MAKSPQSVADLFREYERLREHGKTLYEESDQLLARLVRAWKKDKLAKIDDAHVLEIEDQFRGQVKVFAPAYAHRYRVKVVAIDE